MINNIVFDDTLYTSAISNMSASTTGFRQDLLETQTEFSKLVDTIDRFVKYTKRAMPDMVAEFTSFTSVGTEVKTSFTGVFDAFSVADQMQKGISMLDKMTYGFASITPVLNASGIAMGAQMALTNLAAAAQTLLNAAVMLFPAVLLIGLLVAISACLYKFIKDATKASETQQRLNADTQALKESTDELNKSLEESKAAYAASTSKIETNAGAAKILAEKIYALSDEENKSAEAKRQLSVLVDQLNNTMPGRNLLYNAEADYLSQTTEQEVLWMAA